MRPKKTPIPPEEFNAFLQTLRLQSIRLRRFNAEVLREPSEDGRLHVRVNYTGEEVGCDPLELEGSFHLRIVDEHENEYAEIDAAYRVEYTNHQPTPEGFSDIFLRTNLRLTLYPFFREAVASTIGRMDLPALFLPLNISPAGAPTDTPKSSNSQKKRAKKIS